MKKTADADFLADLDKYYKSQSMRNIEAQDITAKRMAEKAGFDMKTAYRHIASDEKCGILVFVGYVKDENRKRTRAWRLAK